jgi:hypothetical protein
VIRCFETTSPAEGGREDSRIRETDAIEPDRGGGVGSALGATAFELLPYCVCWKAWGEKGGVSASWGSFPDPGALGVEFRESCDVSVSLRGVDLPIDVRDRSVEFGTIISAIESGRVRSSIDSRKLCLVRLSVLRCRIVLSCRTAFCRLRPLILDDEPRAGSTGALELIEVSIVRPGDRL